MASELDQFAELELSKEDREQIFDPPLDRQQMEGAGTSRYLTKNSFFFYFKFKFFLFSCLSFRLA